MKKLLFFILTLLLASCATTHTQEPVIIEKTLRDTVYQKQIQRDSIYVLDSIMIIERNDTVYNTQWHYKIKYIERIDTLREHLIDSIPVPVEIVKYQPLPKWREWTSNLAIVAIVFGMIFLIIKYLPKQ